MLLPLLAVLLHAQTAAPPAWFGPEVATFHVQFTGNPYDPGQNDVKVRFVDGKGNTTERLAYFDEQEGSWKAVLVADHAGPYRPILVRDGKDSTEVSDPQYVQAKTRLPNGFLRVDRDNPTRFAWDSGEPYYPLGHNLGWQGEKNMLMTEQISLMGRNGINWTRIWSDQWDGKNPWWPQDDTLTPTDQLWAPALAKWESLEQACEKAGVAFQMVLFNHGSFSTKTDPNWPDHPWNAAKGGFLKDAADFFTDPEAKRRTKMWLRYAVARYAHSPSLMAWELFNEVEWTDAYRTGRTKEVADWHMEMATYLRSIDPYAHMITTSSITDDAPWMSYLQPHRYPEKASELSLVEAIQSVKPSATKPLFIGEFGPAKGADGDEREVLRDGIYTSMLSGQSGVAAYWYWDRMQSLALYDEFERAAKIIRLSDRVSHPKAAPLTLTVTGRPNAGTAAIGDTSWLMGRITGVEGPAELSFPSLAAGNYSLLTVDLDTGKDIEIPVLWRGLGHTLRVDVPSADVVIVLKAKP